MTTQTPTTEERLSRLEGAYEQVNERLGNIRSDISDVNARIDGLRSDMNVRFNVMLVVTGGVWATLVAALIRLL